MSFFFESLSVAISQHKVNQSVSASYASNVDFDRDTCNLILDTFPNYYVAQFVIENISNHGFDNESI
ncbi:MAG: hypothetical protein ACRCXZ_04315, partial [Patescibacteria group bacterium]